MHISPHETDSIGDPRHRLVPAIMTSLVRLHIAIRRLSMTLHYTVHALTARRCHCTASLSAHYNSHGKRSHCQRYQKHVDLDR